MAAKLPNNTDPRVRRTNERLRAAFISLVHERGFEAVTIAGVVQRAGVGRSTFYTHFGDLDELHASWLQEFTGKSRGERPLMDFLRSFVRHADANRASWHGAARTQSRATFERRFRRQLIGLARDELAHRNLAQNPARMEITSRYVAGGIADVLFWWIDSPQRLSTERLEAILDQITGHALGHAGQKPA